MSVRHFGLFISLSFLSCFLPPTVSNPSHTIHMHDYAYDEFDVPELTTMSKISICGAGMTSLPGQSDCICDKGFTTFGGACVQCPQNSYKDNPGNSSCLSCPSNSISLPQATAIQECICAAGYVKQPDSTCTPCPANTYKSSLLSPDCASCPTHSTAATHSTDITHCLCNPGYERIDDYTCSACAPGSYKNITAASPCRACPIDTYTDTTATITCSACPAHSYTTTTGSSSVDACLCHPSFERNGDLCNPCSENHFCTGANAKEACPDHAVAVQGSSRLQACACVAGYIKAQDAYICQPCSPNFYCPFNTTTQIPCNEHSFSAVASTSEADCVCVPGYQDQSSS